MSSVHFTDAEFLALCERYGWLCLCCARRGRLLYPDLVAPVERGGSTAISNVQPLCRDCLDIKGDVAIDFRVQWKTWPAPAPFDDQGMPINDFDYGLIENAAHRLVVYQRTQAVRRLLHAIRRDWQTIHAKMEEARAVLTEEPVELAWYAAELEMEFFALTAAMARRP